MAVEVAKGEQRWLIVFPLVGILLGVYAFTYSGRIESGDTLTLFNATASIVDFGDVFLDKTSADSPPFTTTPPSFYPLSAAEVEPLQLILTAPIYWLAEHIPGIGLVHAVWFFNIFICAGIAVVLYFYTVTLGYRPIVGVTAALMLGVGTILWPYSKTFFREPLACLFILLSALSMERWRRQRYRSVVYILASVGALAAAFLTKEAVIFALPSLVIILAPAIKFPKRLQMILLILFLAFIAVLILSTVFAASIPYTAIYERLAAILHRSPQQIATAHQAFHTYLLSIGGSVWGTSPVLLLAILGIVMLYREGGYRYPVSIVAMVFAFALGYAVLRGDHWFGGLSWPPRFLIPVLPFVMLGILPVFDKVMRLGVRWWVRFGVILICAYSLWAQISAVSYDWGVYINLLPPDANGLGEWGGGLNVIRYLRWVLIPTQWGHSPPDFDFAWVRVGVSWWPIVCVIVVLICATWLYNLFRFQPQQKSLTLQRRSIFVLALFPFLAFLLIGLGLRSINDDIIYSGSNPSLRSVLPLIQSNTHTGDVLLLADNEYEYFFLNHGKLAYPRVISLPDAPGEQPSPEQPPVIRSTNVDVLLLKTSVPLIYNLAQFHPTLWLLADFGPWHPWAIRPVERFMVTHYYPIRELEPDPPDPRIRLIEYSTAKAPDPFVFRGPDYLSDLRFGDAIQLTGFTLPAGSTYKSGSVIPISLYWQADKALEHDYTVAYFVADASGSVVAQGQDAQPSWGFAPTSSWKPNVPQLDNRALRLPATLTAGTYQIWIRLYQSTNDSIQLAVTGAAVHDSTLGILPVQITITN
ncbi:MAG: hypothetical protein GC179_08070 [Anaerolineaceae bacterium]|nr:hypothetical protein [Anaerolineaceae bacterium]